MQNRSSQNIDKIKMQEENNNKNIQDDEIDLIQLAKTLWEGRRTVIKTTLIFMAIGLFVAIFSEKEYTASCTMVPQSDEGGSKLGGSLGGLAAMAGVNIGSMGSGSVIPTKLYPKLVGSVLFQKEMLKTPLDIEDLNRKVTFQEFYLKIEKKSFLEYIKKYTIGLPRVIIGIFKGTSKISEDIVSTDEILRITGDEKSAMDKLSSVLSLYVNEEEGDITLIAQMSEAKAAAQMVKKAQILLQELITEFKIQKAKNQLIFVNGQFEKKRIEAEQAQNKLAEFRDRNKNITTAKAQAELNRLTAEYNLVYNVYSELAKQLETQKIKVKENTPVFTIIEPVLIPLNPSKPKRVMIIMIWTFIGGIFGVGLVFWKGFISGMKKEWERAK